MATFSVNRFAQLSDNSDTYDSNNESRSRSKVEKKTSYPQQKEVRNTYKSQNDKSNFRSTREQTNEKKSDGRFKRDDFPDLKLGTTKKNNNVKTDNKISYLDAIKTKSITNEAEPVIQKEEEKKEEAKKPVSKKYYDPIVPVVHRRMKLPTKKPSGDYDENFNGEYLEEFDDYEEDGYDPRQSPGNYLCNEEDAYFGSKYSDSKYYNEEDLY